MKMICDVPDEVIKSIKDGTYCGSFMVEKMIAKGIPLSSSEKPNRWIPLNDRLCLPEKDGEYLVTVRGTTNRYYITLCDFALNLYEVDKDDFDNRRGIAGFYTYDSEYDYYEALDAVAWMPLPEPYKASPTGEEDK